MSREIPNGDIPNRNFYFFSDVNRRLRSDRWDHQYAKVDPYYVCPTPMHKEGVEGLQTDLVRAAWNGNAQKISELMEKGVFPNVPDVYGRSPLMLASMKGHEKCIIELIKGGCSVNQLNFDNRMPLTLAAKFGHLGCVNTLLKGGCNPNLTDFYGRTPLQRAARYGHAECVRVLAGLCDLHHIDKCGRSTLVEASAQGHLGCIRVLLEAGCSVNHVDKHHRSALYRAADRGHHECLVELLKAGAEIDHTDDYNATALMFAARRGHTHCVVELINAGCNLNLQEFSGGSRQSALAQAVRHQQIDCARKIATAGCDLDLGNTFVISNVISAKPRMGDCDPITWNIEGRELDAIDRKVVCPKLMKGPYDNPANVRLVKFVMMGRLFTAGNQLKAGNDPPAIKMSDFDLLELEITEERNVWMSVIQKQVQSLRSISLDAIRNTLMSTRKWWESVGKLPLPSALQREVHNPVAMSDKEDLRDEYHSGEEEDIFSSGEDMVDDEDEGIVDEPTCSWEGIPFRMPPY